jgi:hypothetical protein
LTTGHLDKALLGRPFIALAYRQLLKMQDNVDNWKQYFLAWGMTYVTGVRPGSTTVCPGYGEGAALGLSGVVRDEDEPGVGLI